MEFKLTDTKLTIAIVIVTLNIFFQQFLKKNKNNDKNILTI